MIVGLSFDERWPTVRIEEDSQEADFKGMTMVDLPAELVTAFKKAEEEFDRTEAAIKKWCADNQIRDWRNR